ncbi:tRNA-dihydrouridine synthase [Kalmanozyma brasiliensis GHG001]|uniref:tRNA-dihydrouridine(16/17) synthase [NAD(P)(+)] n=1 Tax=Kalmanozyma brasiliensis (strain GHG001) TaxID=1365824 RepID=V5EX14_KALBG|nr:tRNA-dihydrouridine synthase [Kalmanozyma brasiliensis GHG001]EST10185.1 tRNA-dihydrouridine synthase [Kalmanozyma brasiliensis GHG001]
MPEAVAPTAVASGSTNAKLAAATTTTTFTEVGPVEIPDLDSFPPTGTPIHPKLASWDFYRSLHSPQRIVAPMVDQSELPWRILSRRYGSDLVYTPMINAKLFVDDASRKKKVKYQEVNFNKEFGEEGAALLSSEGEGCSADSDRPLFVQFCSNDPSTLLKAAQVVEDRCDAVDLNLGCPQHIARRGHYGSYLMEDWPLIFALINNLHLNLKIPVTAKMRVYESTEKTVAYARLLERAGAQIITVHGRTRAMKGHFTGLADWAKIRAVKQAVGVPVFANGNVLYPGDFDKALAGTGADGVMSAEGNLYNPAIFARTIERGPMFPHAPELPFPSITAMANEYLDIVASLRTPTQSSAIKAHLFRLCRPALEVHKELREHLGKSRFDGAAKGEGRVAMYRAFVAELEQRLEADRKSGKWDERPETMLPGSVSYLTQGEGVYVPHWLAQPYFRPPLVPGEEGGKAKEAKSRAEQMTSVEDVQTKGEEKVVAEEKMRRARSESVETNQAGKKVKLDE